MIGTNVAGYFFITQRVVAQMRKQKSGHMVGMSTVLVDQPAISKDLSQSEQTLSCSYYFVVIVVLLVLDVDNNNDCITWYYMPSYIIVIWYRNGNYCVYRWLPQY